MTASECKNFDNEKRAEETCKLLFCILQVAVCTDGWFSGK